MLEQGQALLLDDALRHPAFSSAESIINGGVRSALCAPLWFASGEKDEVVGLVYLDSNSLVDAFDEEDLGLVTAIASVAAVKIHTTRLLRESRDNRRLQEEVRLAAEMQADLLPQTTPLLAGWSLAGGEPPLPGDGWRLLRLGARRGRAPPRPGRRLRQGGGRGRADGGRARARPLALGRGRPRRAPSRLISRAVFDNVPASRYATAFLARLDPPAGRLRFVNAGHQPALVVRADGSAQPLASSGVPLGLMETAAYTAGGGRRSAPATPSSSTPTASARRATPTGTELGVERLVELARAGPGPDARGLARDASSTAIDAFSAGAPIDDDRTLMVLQRAP